MGSMEDKSRNTPKLSKKDELQGFSKGHWQVVACLRKLFLWSRVSNFEQPLYHVRRQTLRANHNLIKLEPYTSLDTIYHRFSRLSQMRRLIMVIPSVNIIIGAHITLGNIYDPLSIERRVTSPRSWTSATDCVPGAELIRIPASYLSAIRGSQERANAWYRCCDNDQVCFDVQPAVVVYCCNCGFTVQGCKDARLDGFDDGGDHCTGGNS